MNERRSILAVLCVLPAAVPPAAAQSVLAAGARTTPISRAAGLHEVDGQLWGAGDGFKVHFRPEGFAFTPALGERAPRNYPLAFELLSIGRGATPSPLTAAVPRHGGLRVEYDRGAAIERYDVAVDRLEQSFVFGVPPSGSGDLVVRGRLTTDLEVVQDGDGLRFTLPGVGGFTMGGVVGIDARGERVRGRVCYASGILELSLPAAFVDGAALPFVLDPPFGNAFVISGTGGADDRAPSIAYDATNDVFLVVWERVFSATDHDVYAHRVNRSAQPVGTMLFVETTTQLAIEPQVANCNARDAFVVVYTRNEDILARAVSASTGLMGGTAVIAGGTAAQIFGCVAGDSINSQVLCVWHSTVSTPLFSRGILAASVAIDANLTLTPNTTRSVASGTLIGRPRVSKSDRGRGRHAVVYPQGTSNGDANPVLRIVDGNGVVLSSALVLSTHAANQTVPEVDGDGTNWLAVWQTAIARNVIEGTSVSFDAASRQLVQNAPPIAMASGLFEDCINPRAIWIADSGVVGYSRQVAQQPPTVAAAQALSVDPFACTSCEGEFFAGLTTRLEGPPAGCAVQAFGGTGEDVMLAWEQALANNGDIIVRRWRTIDGDATSLGGQCGRGGSNHATCARSPNNQFAHRLRDALPAAPAVFVFSASQASFPCGSCDLIPGLAGAILVPGATDGSGEAILPVPIPQLSPLIGVPFFTQWATIDLSAPACTLFSLHLSNALRIVIEA